MHRVHVKCQQQERGPKALFEKPVVLLHLRVYHIKAVNSLWTLSATTPCGLLIVDAACMLKTQSANISEGAKGPGPFEKPIVHPRLPVQYKKAANSP